MAARTNAAPVIIKKKKIVGAEGHHGGAWKVAYADFVTAMMAFFMLMWLLNATTEKQRKGIADYFNPTTPINRISGGGNDLFGGDSVMKEQFLANNGTGGLPTTLAGGPKPATESGAEQEKARLSDVQDMLIGGGGESFLNDNLKKHVVTRLTDEGLVIELFDTAEDQLFVEGQTQPYRLLIDLVRVVSEAARLVRNGIAVEGYVRTEPVVKLRKVSWKLSMDRADTVRGLLESHGIPVQRMERVTGHADREQVARDPRALRNNRIEIILLRSDVR